MVLKFAVWPPLLAATLAAAIAFEARAQIASTRARISRPTQSVSQRFAIGRTYVHRRPEARGGLFRQQPLAARSPERVQRRDFRAGADLSRSPMSPLAIPPRSTTQNTFIRSPYRLIGTGRVRTQDLAAVSRLNKSYSLTVPVGGWGWQRSTGPFLTIPEYLPPKTENVYRASFGLAAPPDEAETHGPAPESLADIMEQRRKERVQAAEERGRELFRLATAEECEDRSGTLQRAVGELTIARNHGDGSHVPALLIAHAALAQEQAIRAATGVLDAVERRPTMFKERVVQEIRECFGDPNRFDEQIRAYLHAADKSEFAVEANVLSAYCAWALNDGRRARSYIAAAEELSKEREFYGRVRRMRLALDAALR